MIAEIGHLALVLALLLAIVQGTVPMWGAARRDAAMMALGRVFGPLMGGALYTGGTSLALGLAAFASLGTAACLLLAVDRAQYVVNPAT